MVQGPDPLVLLAAFFAFPIAVAVGTVVIAALPRQQREVTLATLAVLFVCFAPRLMAL